MFFADKNKINVILVNSEVNTEIATLPHKLLQNLLWKSPIKKIVRILILIYSYEYKFIDIVRVYFGIHSFKQIMLRELAARSLSYSQVPHFHS